MKIPVKLHKLGQKKPKSKKPKAKKQTRTNHAGASKIIQRLGVYTPSCGLHTVAIVHGVGSSSSPFHTTQREMSTNENVDADATSVNNPYAAFGDEKVDGLSAERQKIRDLSPAELMLSDIQSFKDSLPEKHLLQRNTRKAQQNTPPPGVNAADVDEKLKPTIPGRFETAQDVLNQKVDTINKKPATKKPTDVYEPVLHSFNHKPLHEVLQETQPLTRKQTKELIEVGTSSEVIQDLMKKIPKQFCLCRGCGVQFQYDKEDKPGFIPAPNLQSYLLRMDIQLRAAKQDLRIRSGGGKGQGTAVAALHAALKSSLAFVQKEADARLGKVGRFKEDHLRRMGLDKFMRPLPRPIEWDPETGAPKVIIEPEDHPVLASAEHLKKRNEDIKKRIEQLMNDPTADINEINALQQQVTAEKTFYDLDEESKKVPKQDILNKRDVDMLERAAKLAAKPAKCQRCHRLSTKQYGAVAQNVSQSIPAEEFVRLLHNEFQNENAKSSIIIKLVDVLDFHGSMIQDLAKITGPRNPIILAVNKCDVLPKNVTPQQIQTWAKAEVERYGLNVHSVFTISAATGHGVDDLLNKALLLARGQNDPTAPKNRNIYVMGTTNAGKSTLVNQLLKKSIIGTGMPNDVTGIKRNKKDGGINADEGNPNFIGKGVKKNRKKGQDGEFIDDDEDAMLAEMIDTQPLDDEMEQELIEAKKAERAAKKAAKGGAAANGNNENGEKKLELKDQLFSTYNDRDNPLMNPVIADIDVAGISKVALDAVMPSEYLLQHQQELQIKEAAATTSPIPGTTLGIVSFPVLEKKRGGKNLQIKDTPGVLNAWQLTSHLSYPELKRVLPTKRLQPLTYRIQPGQSIFLGALARIDMISGKPFSISNFVSSAMSVHIASSSRVDVGYLKSQIGVNLIPPFDPEMDNRGEDLAIYTNLANKTDEECQALKELQIAARAEARESKERARQKIEMDLKKQRHGEFSHKRQRYPDEVVNAKGNYKNKNNNNDNQEDPYSDDIAVVDGDSQDGDDIKPFSAQNILNNIPEVPKSGVDTLTHLRADLRQKMSAALGKLAPVSTNTSSLPSRTFIDSEGRLVVQLTGCGFHEASHDIVIAGLGWVSVTGSGPCTFRISIAGEDSRLNEEDLELIAREMKRGRSPDDDAVIQTQSNIDPLISAKTGISGPRLPQRIKRLLSRVTIRDPLVPGQGRYGDKWTGIPELVKKAFSPEMQEQRNRLIKRNEQLRLWQKNPEIHPHPDEMDRGHFDLDIPEGYQPPEMVEMYEGRVLEGDIHTGMFDGIRHPTPEVHSKEEVQLFTEKLAHKMEEKQIMEDWEYIQQYHAKQAIGQAANLDIDIQDEIAKNLEANKESMEILRETLMDSRPNKDKLAKQKEQEELQAKRTQWLAEQKVLAKQKKQEEYEAKLREKQEAALAKKKNKKAATKDEDGDDDDDDDDDSDDDDSEETGWENPGQDEDWDGTCITESSGEFEGTDEELITDVNKLLEMTESEDVSEDAQKLVQQEQQQKQKQQSEATPTSQEQKQQQKQSKFEIPAHQKAQYEQLKALQKMRPGYQPTESSESTQYEDEQTEYPFGDSDSSEATLTSEEYSSEDGHNNNKKQQQKKKQNKNKKPYDSDVDSSDDFTNSEDDINSDEYTMVEGSTEDDYDSSEEGQQQQQMLDKKALQKAKKQQDDNALYLDPTYEKPGFPRLRRDLIIQEQDDALRQRHYEMQQRRQQQQQQTMEQMLDDMPTEEGPDLTSDVEVITDLNQMPTLDEIAELSDFDGVDYNELRHRGLLDAFLAKQNELINKQPVPTGPQGKKETGGRRARAAMGLIKEDKFDELKRVQKEKEAKMLSNYMRKAAKVARYEQLETEDDIRRKKGKGKSNAATSRAQKQPEADEDAEAAAFMSQLNFDDEFDPDAPIPKHLLRKTKKTTSKDPDAANFQRPKWDDDSDDQEPEEYRRAGVKPGKRVVQYEIDSSADDSGSEDSVPAIAPPKRQQQSSQYQQREPNAARTGNKYGSRDRSGIPPSSSGGDRQSYGGNGGYNNNRDRDNNRGGFGARDNYNRDNNRGGFGGRDNRDNRGGNRGGGGGFGGRDNNNNNRRQGGGGRGHFDDRGDTGINFGGRGNRRPFSTTAPTLDGMIDYLQNKQSPLM